MATTPELSTESKQKLDGMLAGKSTPEIMEYRGYIQIIKDKYRNEAYVKDPLNTTVYEQAVMTKVDINHTNRSLQGVNFIAMKAQKEGTKEAQGILSKYTQAFAENAYGDSIVRAVDTANPWRSYQAFNDFEKSKSQQTLELEQAAKTEDQYNAILARANVDTPAPGARSILNSEDNYLKNFSSDKAVNALIKSCIPCEFRVVFKAEFGLPWLNTTADLMKKWKDLAKMLRDLTTWKPGEFSKDLCNLFKFLDGQCIPDIAGLMSLLSLMQLKYTDLGRFSLGNILSQLMAPFLTPVIGSFTSNLDKYGDLILGPLKCIVKALEFQINNLQTQINGAINIADVNRTKYKTQQAEFLDRKALALRNRKRALQLKQTNNENKLTSLINSGRSDFATLDSTTEVRTIPKNTLSSSDGTREDRVAQSKLIRGGVPINVNNSVTNTFAKGTSFVIEKGNEGAGKLSNSTPQVKRTDTFQRTIEGEIEQIDSELESINNQRVKINKELEQYMPNSANINKSNTLQGTLANQTLTPQLKYALNNLEKAQRSILSDLTDAINDGMGIIKQSIDIYRDEFQRLLLGRISTQEDQIEFTKLVQQFARLGSVVGTVMSLKKNGLFNIKRLCEGEKGPTNALAQLAKGLKENDNNGMFDFYQAQDAEGNPLIVIAPGGAKVNVSSVDFSNVGDDQLFGDSSVDLASVTKTVSFNDLNEVDKLNREGIVPDLGNIDGKQIELSAGLKEGSELDLHFKTSYAIISNEFCSKSGIEFGSSDSVKNWAAGLWQKN